MGNVKPHLKAAFPGKIFRGRACYMRGETGKIDEEETTTEISWLGV